MAVEELREAFPDAVIRAVDTLCASMGQGLLVDLAVQEKRKGKSLEEVASFVQETIPHLCHWFTVGISASCAGVGGCLPAKPLWGTC